MKKLLLLTLSLFFISIGIANGTHLRAGEIRAIRENCSSLTYRIILTIYTNTDSPTHQDPVPGWFGGGTLNWGQGSVQVPRVTNVTVVNPQLKIAVGTYERLVTYSQPGTYTISFEEAHRDAGILNIPNQNSNINFYVEDQIIVSNQFCDSSPSFLVPPIDEACRGQVFYHNPGATDVDGDSLSYSITIPKGDGGIIINGYTDPNNSKFYTGLNYALANSEQNGPPTFSIDPVTGLLTFDAPGNIGNYNIALKVTQWKKNPADSSWMQFGYVVRDMQITVSNCSNHPPDIQAQNDVCILAGELFEVDLRGTDQDLDNVTIEIFTDIITFNESPAKFKYANALQSTSSPDTAHIFISWTPDCIRVRDQPYQVVLKITDNPPNGGVKLSRFRSFNIKVMGPPPDITDVHVNPVEKEVTILWDSYFCQNAESIQVWRRVSKRNYTQPECETGMPKSLQYVLLDELPGNSIFYIDTDLAIGAQYCYRVVARFKDTSSKISLDTCFIPQPAKAPVITHVTVSKTDPSNGQIRVSWTPPFDIDPIQYPPPYSYKVQRGNGFEGENWNTITSVAIADTFLIDNPIATFDTAYHYRVLLYVPTLSTSVVDTSSIASSVKLESQSRGDGIKLTWDAKVPWYLFLENYPYHYIYRSETNNDNDFVLIDSTEVNEDGFVYLDQGAFNNQGLDDHKVYYYKVKTMGAYGNPRIHEPLINYSQIVSDHVKDTIPPCPPIIIVLKPDCENLPCALSYSNNVSFENSDANGCQDDVVYYEIYMAENSDSEFTISNNHIELTSFAHNNLSDLSVCYKVIAVDWVGNRSDYSDVACGENCPSIYLPNVFTPGTSTGKNDLFRPIYASDQLINNECTRFIDHMKLLVINRMGKEIYQTESDDFTDVFWDGKDSEGSEMPSGVYYFLADVDLKYASDKKEYQQIKGWVHLVR